MDSDSDNISGILSLSGFAYQILVFVELMPKLKSGSQIEFETLDDIAVNKKDVPRSLDETSSETSQLLFESPNYTSIQVKRTDISTANKLKIICNWLLSEGRTDRPISSYVLITECPKVDTEELFYLAPEKFLQEIEASKKKANSLATRVKKKYAGDLESFRAVYNAVKRKYRGESRSQIIDSVYSAYATLFHKGGVTDTTYKLRVREFTNHIMSDILESISRKTPYICSYEQFMRKVVQVSAGITDTHVELDYGQFRRSRLQTLEESDVSVTREFLQLHACGFSTKLIEDRLMQNEFYKELRFRLMSNNQSDIVDNIQLTAHENFENSKDFLKRDGKDFPAERYYLTTGSANHYAPQNQARVGSCIYLTSAGTEPELIISWSDDEI